MNTIINSSYTIDVTYISHQKLKRKQPIFRSVLHDNNKTIEFILPHYHILPDFPMAAIPWKHVSYFPRFSSAEKRTFYDH